jgi:hypothetical protein
VEGEARAPTVGTTRSTEPFPFVPSPSQSQLIAATCNDASFPENTIADEDLPFSIDEGYQDAISDAKKHPSAEGGSETSSIYLLAPPCLSDPPMSLNDLGGSFDGNVVPEERSASRSSGMDQGVFTIGLGNSVLQVGSFGTAEPTDPQGSESTCKSSESTSSSSGKCLAPPALHSIGV